VPLGGRNGARVRDRRERLARLCVQHDSAVCWSAADPAGAARGRRPRRSRALAPPSTGCLAPHRSRARAEPRAHHDIHAQHVRPRPAADRGRTGSILGGRVALHVSVGLLQSGSWARGRSCRRHAAHQRRAGARRRAARAGETHRMNAGQTRRLALGTALLVVAAAFLLPELWLLALAFKTKARVYEYPPRLISPESSAANYLFVFTQTQVPWYLWNSARVAALATVFTMAMGAPAAYVLSRERFRRRDAILSGL